ncbi:43479_t:CDS:2 [Gigaspora margarita]|uniref:43479_t:CDS:1 n=1 Tax=Gigaspora margarita TaxID=4874 RepID=A0ABN7WIG1_GIGMA|nr:43479_t:CDS:2 [Gigaspora margarita]
MANKNNQNQTYFTFENAESKKIVDLSNSILKQLLPNNVSPPLVLNSSMETPDISKPPIEVTYCNYTYQRRGHRSLRICRDRRDRLASKKKRMSNCNKREEIIKNIETLEYLVDNLDEELGISEASEGINELEE